MAALRSSIGSGKTLWVAEKYARALDVVLETETSQLMISDPAVGRALDDLDPAATVVDETLRRRVLRPLRDSKTASATLRTLAKATLEASR